MSETTKRISETKAMRVAYAGVRDESGKTIAPKRWRLSLFRDGEWRALTGDHDKPDYYFARKVDAEMALAGLVAAGIDSYETLKAAGGRKCRRIMGESLAW